MKAIEKKQVKEEELENVTGGVHGRFLGQQAEERRDRKLNQSEEMYVNIAQPIAKKAGVEELEPIE